MRFVVETNHKFHNEVKVKAAIEGRTISSIVLDLLEDWFKEPPVKPELPAQTEIRLPMWSTAFTEQES